jgi:glutathione S-transferase
MKGEGKQECMEIGYFGIRAKAQVCRLLCEHLGLPYRDRFFTPEEWEEYERTEAKDWIIKGLPYLRDGNFVVTGQHGMIEYVVRKAGRLPLLGTSMRDRIKIDVFKSKHDIKDNIIALICQVNRSNPKERPQHAPEFYWETKIQPKLVEIEQSCSEHGWCFGYLTVADFSFYEMMNNLLWLFPNIATAFPKLMNLRNQVLALQAVASYEASDRAVKIFNPVFFFRECEGSGRRMEVETR